MNLDLLTVRLMSWGINVVAYKAQLACSISYVSAHHTLLSPTPRAGFNELISTMLNFILTTNKISALIKSVSGLTGKSKKGHCPVLEILVCSETRFDQ